MQNKGAFTINVGVREAGIRLDVFVSSHIPNSSRSHLSNIIRKGMILVHGKVKKPGYRVATGDIISGEIPPQKPAVFKPEPVNFNIIHEDREIIVINKPPGLVVHPAPGNYTGTLVNGLLYYFPDIKEIGDKIRPGIVHRLDKDTSGVIVVAKTRFSHNYLADQFKYRKIQKDYLALVYGKPDSESGIISLPIGRHPVNRKKMSTYAKKGRFAETIWQVREYFNGAALIELGLKTGRTHQIRVHCASIGHPVIGDSVYGSGKTFTNYIKDRKTAELISTVKRQMLHALKLTFKHPDTEQIVRFEAPVPDDMKKIIKGLTRISNTNCAPFKPETTSQRKPCIRVCRKQDPGLHL